MDQYSQSSRCGSHSSPTPYYHAAKIFLASHGRYRYFLRCVISSRYFLNNRPGSTRIIAFCIIHYLYISLTLLHSLFTVYKVLTLFSWKTRYRVCSLKIIHHFTTLSCLNHWALWLRSTWRSSRSYHRYHSIPIDYCTAPQIPCFFSRAGERN